MCAKTTKVKDVGLTEFRSILILLVFVWGKICTALTDNTEGFICSDNSDIYVSPSTHTTHTHSHTHTHTHTPFLPSAINFFFKIWCKYSNIYTETIQDHNEIKIMLLLQFSCCMNCIQQTCNLHFNTPSTALHHDATLMLWYGMFTTHDQCIS